MTVREPETEPEPATLATEPVEPVVPAVPPCPRCGRPLREEQDWCLNCGAAATSRIAAPAGWRAPLAVIAAVVALAFAGLLIAFLAVSDDSDELTRLAAQQAAQPAATATPAPPAATPAATPVPSATPGGQTVPPATAGDDAGDLPGLDSLPQANDANDAGGSSGSGGSSKVGTWPSGRSAFTVVLLSSPSRAGANRRARELAKSGTDVGVLDSDDFKSLNGGFFVVFSGQFDSRAAAEDALGSLSGDTPGAYVRRVTPR